MNLYMEVESTIKTIVQIDMKPITIKTNQLHELILKIIKLIFSNCMLRCLQMK